HRPSPPPHRCGRPPRALRGRLQPRRVRPPRQPARRRSPPAHPPDRRRSQPARPPRSQLRSPNMSVTPPDRPPAFSLAVSFQCPDAVTLRFETEDGRALTLVVDPEMLAELTRDLVLHGARILAHRASHAQSAIRNPNSEIV